MAEEKRYFWLKLQDDFFSSKRIKKLRKMAGGDTYTIIYLKLQLLALKSEGVLTFTGLEEDFADELSLDIDESPDDIKVTLAYLLHCGLAETSDNVNFFFPYAIENTGSEGSSAKRMREARKKAKISELPSHCANEVQTLCEHRYGEKEIEKEIDIDYIQIRDLYNETCVSLPKITSLSDKRKKAIKARLKTYTVDQIKEVFEKAEASSFLKGKNKRDWQANFDWLMKDANMAKVLDGNYDDRKPSGGENNFATYDLDLFEKMLNSD